MNKKRILNPAFARPSKTNALTCGALTSSSLSAAIAAVLFLALGGVGKLQAIQIDLGASGLVVESDRIGFSELNGTPVSGTGSEDFHFAHNAFVRLYSVTDSTFCANIRLQTSGTELVGFLSGTGYLIDARGNAIPGYGITGRASSSDGSMVLGLFPLLKDPDGTPNEELNRPLDFYGVHFDIIFPDVQPSLEFTGGQFYLSASGTTFGIGPHVPINIVPDAGSTALLFGLAILVLFALLTKVISTSEMTH